jgi:hypothetical protein
MAKGMAPNIWRGNNARNARRESPLHAADQPSMSWAQYSIVGAIDAAP